MRASNGAAMCMFRQASWIVQNRSKLSAVNISLRFSYGSYYKLNQGLKPEVDFQAYLDSAVKLGAR
ncbi:MAG: hypothetical protein ACLSA6_12975 [Holdemania massiliensis]